MKDGMPICLGYLAVSFAFGMKVCAGGLPVWLAGLISLSNLTSAGQFAGTNLILSGAAYAEIFFTTFIINLRYFLMAMSLSQKLDGSFNTFRRMSMAHGVTDEIFAVAVGRKGLLSPVYMCGLITTPVLGWTAGTVLGGIFANVLPDSIVGAFGIALYAMFIAIFLPPAKKEKPVLYAVLIAVAISTAFAYIPGLKEISSGWVIIIATVASAGLMATFFPIGQSQADAAKGGEV